MNNQYLKQLSTSKIADMINYVFPGYGQSIITERNDERSEFRVIHLDTEDSFTVTIDDYEGIVNKNFINRGILHSLHHCMDGEEMIRFHAFMYHNFKSGYMKALARHLSEKYAEDR